MSYFDSDRDSAVVTAGGFFCQACLTGKPASEASADKRYCYGCFEFLAKEAKQASSWRIPKWAPAPDAKIASLKDGGVSRHPTPIMHTTKQQEIPSEHNYSLDLKSKRGPKYRDLPVDLIEKWADDGAGAKAIASRLKKERGLTVHYSTILRLLSGKRQLTLPLEVTE